MKFQHTTRGMQVSRTICPTESGGCGEHIFATSDVTLNANFEPMHTTCFWSASEAAEAASEAAGCE